jgi:small conductance mechanosensitive channel
VAGLTREINLFYTEIDSDDNTRIIIPNGKLWGEIVRVPSRNDTARVDLHYQRPASEDIGTAIARLKELIGRDQRIRRVADVGVETIGDANYTLTAHVWVERANQTAALFDLNRTIKEEFDKRAFQSGAKSGPAAVERRAG